MTLISSTAALVGLMMDVRRSRNATEPLRRKRLQSVLRAAAAVPHYRKQMDAAGYDPARDFSGFEDLKVLSIVRKEDVKAAPDTFVQESELNRLHTYFSDRTSGSTGVPLSVYRSPRERALQIAKWLRVLMLNGYRPTDKVLSYTSPGRLSEGRSLLQSVGLLRREAFDYRRSPAECADALLRYGPDVVYGVRTSLLLVCDELERRGVKGPPLKLLVAGGEVIDEQTRHRCRQILGKDITETYGTVEMGVMAYQRQGELGLNLIEDCTYFEFLDEKGDPTGPGQLARIIVTDLNGAVMPFIRYEQGDLVVYSLRQNQHGETVKVIDRILGRQDDMAPLPNGTSLTYLNFYEIMDVYAGITRFRVRQLTPTFFRVELIADPDYLRSIRDELLSKLRRLSQLPLSFEVRLVEQISPDPSGKMRMLLSDVQPPGKGRDTH